MPFELIQVISMIALYAAAIAMASLCSSLLKAEDIPEERNKTLDGLRALAAVGVAASHINQHVCAYSGATGVPHIGNHVEIVGVQMFFALTAYLFTDRALRGRIQPLQFLSGRIRRIIPLYTFAVAAAIGIATLYTLNLQTSLAQSVKEIFKVYTYGFWVHHAISFKGFNMLRLLCVAWTLSYEWAFYLLLIPASMIWSRYRVAMFAIIAVAVGLVINQYSYKSEQVIWPFFFPGVIAAFLNYYLPKPPAAVRQIASVASIAFFVLMITTPGYWTAMKLGYAVCLFLSVYYGQAPLLNWKPLQSLATVSFSVYLLQYLLLGPAALYINHNPEIFSNQAIKVASVFSVMIALIPVSFLTYLFIEKPFMTRGASGSERKRPACGSELKVTDAVEERSLVSIGR
ncbi:MAG: hypothetical protein DKT66_18225 [Candidatus Melainabacteria bacterium]|nr:MAG: hypothetical protein DKT66_18225 [Candidatus Melainabacteria bacterium]